MMVAILVAACGFAVLGVLLAARFLEMRTWQRSLLAYRLILPADLSGQQVADWLTQVAASTHPPDWSLLPLPPVAVEIIGSARGVAHYLLVARSAESQLLAGLRATLPGARIELEAGYLSRPVMARLAAEAVLTSQARPLAAERAGAAVSALLAALQPVGPNSEIRYQIIMTSAGTPPRVTAPKDSPYPWAAWRDGALPSDAEAVQAARAKQHEVLLRAVIRVGVTAPTSAQARALFGRVWPVLHTMNAPSVRIRRRWLLSGAVARRLGRDYPIGRWPMLLNAAEAVAVVGLPLSGLRLPGLPLHAARQLPPAPSMPTAGLVLARSNYPGLAARPLALSTVDRLRHVYLLGPTGSGKSWLLAQMILQDIAAGHGLVAIDPKGDLITDVLARIADADQDRVVVLDASKRDQPIGLNVLATGADEESRELAVDQVLHVFKEIWAPFWGPRSDHIMRASLATLVTAHGTDRSRLTMCELLPLLTQPAFRRAITAQPGMSGSLKAFWQWYEQLSDGERQQAIGPVANKVEAFTGRTPIRLLLGQSGGVDLGAVFRDRKVVLVSLAKGKLGTETASLLGALLVAKLWQTALTRVQVPPERRRPVFAYIDEAADIMRLPVGLSEMFAQARGLGLGIVAATQLIAQVPEHVKAALLGTVRTQISFAVEYDDANLLARRFAPLVTEDLTGLGSYEVALRPCVGGITLAPVTGTTLPLGPAVRGPDELAAASRQRYGTPRRDVEAALAARVATRSAGPSGFGRRPSGGQ